MDSYSVPGKGPIDIYSVPERGSVSQPQGGIVYLLRDEFLTDATAPLSSPRTCEPGPGTLTLVQTDGQFSIVSGKFTFPSQASALWSDQGFVAATGVARLTGRGLFALFNYTALGNSIFGWHSSTTLPGGGAPQLEHGFQQAGIVYKNQSSGGQEIYPTLSTGVDYPIALVLRTTGAFWFIKISGTWRLIWVDTSGASATVYPMFNNFQTAGSIDYLRVRDLSAPFNTDYGIASVNVTSFTQSLGAELITNGNFSAWTGDNPDGWTVTGEVGADPEVTQRAPNQGHAGAGTGAANLYSSATSTQPRMGQVILTVGGIYEVGTNVTNRVSGSVAIQDNNTGLNASYAATGNRRQLGRALGTTFRVITVSVPADVTIDDVSVKQVTLNSAQTINADSVIDFEFTLPGSPIAGQKLSLLYRIAAAGEELLNCWELEIVRLDSNTAWGLNLYSISAGIKTNRISVVDVGTPDTIRVICEGNNHDCYTRASTGAWTKRGATISNSTHATATLVNTVYNSGITPVRFTPYPRTSVAYAALDAS